MPSLRTSSSARSSASEDPESEPEGEAESDPEGEPEPEPATPAPESSLRLSAISRRSAAVENRTVEGLTTSPFSPSSEPVSEAWSESGRRASSSPGRRRAPA
ncbi:hypothetical protein SVIO_076990 [Streptomyces violaceusniger]|uniref:Uncharacterized protein n=1 Tax=Streptomyces violaceusniger TaxID=68280 RepID=A0A4D4LCY8_STRVO|nr:hypothetical protein SVIO_076990 [Streptomyces violaceusniger]